MKPGSSSLSRKCLERLYQAKSDRKRTGRFEIVTVDLRNGPERAWLCERQRVGPQVF